MTCTATLPIGQYLPSRDSPIRQPLFPIGQCRMVKQGFLVGEILLEGWGSQKEETP